MVYFVHHSSHFFEFSSYYSLLYCTYEQNYFYEFKEML